MWAVELQTWTEKRQECSGFCKQIKWFPKEMPDLTTKFFPIKDMIFRIVLGYKCQDGTTDICWVTWTRYGFKFHYPDRQVLVDTLLMTYKAVANAEDSMPLATFAPWLAKKIGTSLASEVVHLFLNAKQESMAA